MNDFAESFVGTLVTWVFMALMFLYSIGGLYWLWIAIQLGSFGAFVLGIFPPSAIFTAGVGAYALVFGTPDWVFEMFG